MAHPFRKLIDFLTPPPMWRVPVIISLAVLVGLGLVVLRISNAVSYLSDDPKACINCHVMWPEYVTWQHSSHARVAICNDCHVPHDNVFHKYAFKAMDGLRHSSMFTFRMEPQVIRTKSAGIAVIQENCKRCHEPLISRVSLRTMTAKTIVHGEGKLCWQCHRETPHGRVKSLSATPNAQVPGLSPVAPAWLEKLIPAQNPN